MVNIVTIGGQRYIVDVGFGAKGPINPVPLTEGLVHPHIAPASVRIIRTVLPQHTDRTRRLWVYQHRDDDNSLWTDVCCFTDVEFFQADFQSITVGTTFRRNSAFSYTIAMARMMLASEMEGPWGDATDEIIGTVMVLDRRVKRTLHGKKLL